MIKDAVEENYESDQDSRWLLLCGTLISNESYL